LKLSHILTAPNQLTLLRMVFIPFVVLSLIDHEYKQALVLLVIAGLTDLFDGFLARQLHQQTRIGQYLDPIADKILVEIRQRLKFLNAELLAAKTHKLEAQNSLVATDENIKRLKQRLADVERQVSDNLNDLQRPLRLPREHETGKRVVYVIARYGHVYPCRNSDLSRNEIDINWISKHGGEIAEPIPGKGLDPTINLRGLESYFSGQPRESVYLVFCVFEDSFPAFIRARQLAVASSVAYGWEPFREADGPVAFGETGHTPKAQ